MNNQIWFASLLFTSLIILALYFSQRPKLPEIIRNAYCIAIPERKERAKRTLNSVGIYPVFMNPVLKTSLNRDQLIRSGFLSRTSILNEGRIACHMSHLNVMKDFLSKPLNTCTIFEDDIMTQFSKKEITDIVNSLEADIKRISKDDKYDWDILYLSKCWDQCNNIKKLGKYLYDTPNPVCRHAYVVTRRGAQRILAETSYMDKLPGDEMYRKLIKDQKLKAYSCAPQLFWQNRQSIGIMKSNLGNDNLNIPECLTTGNRVTVAIMNFMRPDILRFIVSQLVIYPNVSEVLVINNNKATKLSLYHPKVKSIDAWESHEKNGVANRFIYAAKYSTNYQILFIDDDILPSHQYIDKLLKAAKKDPNNIYGFFKRVCNSQDGYISDKKVTDERYDTIITGTMLTSKQIVYSFLDNKHYAEWLSTNKEKANVIWNGEDLFINMVLKQIYKKMPVYVIPDSKEDVRFVKKKNTPDDHAISKKPGHYDYRTDFCKSVNIPSV